MKINDKMQIAYTQVDTVLNFYNQDLLAISIPQEVRDYIRKNKSKSYQFNINANEFKADMLTAESVSVLLWIFENYFATEKQKEIISNWEYHNINFENKKVQNKETTNQELVCVQEESFIIKIINKIKLIFKIRKNTDE
ncbi:MAG: hypothetical protein BHW02_02140 [Clostridium sp. 28_12]|nr:MAG: hypothetical protein BHW02_02140 [Clostridium sp. 28_12]